jgi:Ca2+-binding RTX toxin-like protein
MSLVTGNNSIDSLAYSSWARNAGTAVSLTYSFMTSAPADGSADDVNGFAPMSATQQAAARTALALWANVANITFTEVASGGKIQLGTNDQGNQSSGYAYLPNGSDPTYLFVNNADHYNSVFTSGSYGPQVLLHELGHTLGLKHPGNYDSTGSTIDGPFLPAATDNNDYTVMSYTDPTAHNLNGQYVAGPMLYDIQAMQYLYGANMQYHTGTDSYQFNDSSAPVCIWDAGGTDTFDFSGCSGTTVIDLRAGGFSSTAPNYHNVSIAYNVVIERAIAGNGGATIYANGAGDVITGGNGSDTIYEGAGSDQINGGQGGDSVVFSSTYSHYTLSNTGGTLKVAGDGTDILSGIETLVFSDRTVQVSDIGTILGGTSGNDRIVVQGGNQTISTGAGIDTLVFGGARANYTVSASGSEFTVTGAGATDLLSGVERLQFSDSAVALDVGGEAGQTYRLYQAAFNRVPDLGGVGFWLDQMDRGLSLLRVSQYFVESPEFVATYGNLNNTQFVTQMYANVLHRAPDSPGLQFYLDAFDHGVSRAQVLQGFSESPENQAAVIGSITNGVNFIPVLG